MARDSSANERLESGFDETAIAMVCAACMPFVVFLMVGTFNAAAAAAMPPTIIVAVVEGSEKVKAWRIPSSGFFLTLTRASVRVVGEAALSETTIFEAMSSTCLRLERSEIPVGAEGSRAASLAASFSAAWRNKEDRGTYTQFLFDVFLTRLTEW